MPSKRVITSIWPYVLMIAFVVAQYSCKRVSNNPLGSQDETIWVSQSSGTTNTLYSVSFADAHNGTVVGHTSDDGRG
jgi:glucosamine 6-phosphate synthetase-like amidotransferase/phosphosugar isomerase protein